MGIEKHVLLYLLYVLTKFFLNDNVNVKTLFFVKLSIKYYLP